MGAKDRLVECLNNYIERGMEDNVDESLRTRIANGLDAFESTEDCEIIFDGLDGQAIVIKIDEYYFEGAFGRKPKNDQEIYDLADELRKGISVSADWETIYQIAIDKLNADN